MYATAALLLNLGDELSTERGGAASAKRSISAVQTSARSLAYRHAQRRRALLLRLP